MLNISNIQRFSLHDGPGIRTVIFLKGCNLHCPWCANPENINNQMEYMFDKERCIGDRDGCILNVKCSRYQAETLVGEKICDELECPISALFSVSKNMNIDEIKKIVWKDYTYYQNGGGVTISGGEPLLQLDELTDLIGWLHSNKISVIVETALFVSSDVVQRAIHLFDAFYIDMKIMNRELCRDILGGNLEIYEKNLDIINRAEIPYTVRIPIVKPFSFEEGSMKKMKQSLRRLAVMDVEIFKIHTLAKKKYEMLGKKVVHFEEVSEDEIQYFKEELEQLRICVKILLY